MSASIRREQRCYEQCRIPPEPLWVRIVRAVLITGATYLSTRLP